MQKPAETNHTIHALLQERWSPRAYAPRPIEEEKLLSVLEAARWSPSGGNQQPWSFVVVTRDDAEVHKGLIEAMTGRNPAWADKAPMLLVAVARLNLERPEGNRFAFYDVGQAVAHMSIQAHALGLHVHQMAGFDTAKVRQVL
jgi:nitroreductase